jgi:hypothetical protein
MNQRHRASNLSGLSLDGYVRVDRWRAARLFHKACDDFLVPGAEFRPDLVLNAHAVRTSRRAI